MNNFRLVGMKNGGSVTIEDFYKDYTEAFKWGWGFFDKGTKFTIGE